MREKSATRLEKNLETVIGKFMEGQKETEVCYLIGTGGEPNKI